MKKFVDHWKFVLACIHEFSYSSPHDSPSHDTSVILLKQRD